MTASLISEATHQYTEMVALRKRILRDPLGLTFTENDLSRDKDDLLCGYYNDEDKLIGTCILTHISSSLMQLRQMAIETGYQNKGIGYKLLRFAEETAAQHQYKKITLHARKTAVGFYEKAGYKIVGEEFTEVGIPHLEMEKTL